MLRTPRKFLIGLLLVIFAAAVGCTTNRACKLKVNKKKLDYYNSLQYRGVKKR